MSEIDYPTGPDGTLTANQRQQLIALGDQFGVPMNDDLLRRIDNILNSPISETHEITRTRFAFHNQIPQDRNEKYSFFQQFGQIIFGLNVHMLVNRSARIRSDGRQPRTAYQWEARNRYFYCLLPNRTGAWDDPNHRWFFCTYHSGYYSTDNTHSDDIDQAPERVFLDPPHDPPLTGFFIDEANVNTVDCLWSFHERLVHLENFTQQH